MYGKIDPHVRYYDSTVVNNEEFAIPAEIKDLRGKSVLDNPSEWEMSVVRFDVNTSLIPPSTIPMVGTPVVGVLSDSELTFTMTYLGVDTQLAVQNDTAGQIFGFDRLLDQMNTALASLHSGLAPPPASTTPPILAFNPDTQLISMYYEDVYATVGDIELWINYKTREKLPALPIETFAGFNQPNGKDFRLCFTCGSAKNTPTLVAGVRDGLPVITNVIPDPMRVISQEAVVISSWNTVRSIKLITNTIPIVSEMEPSTTQVSGQGGTTSNVSNTISDFLITSVDNPLVDRLTLEYLPTAEYRMIAMLGEQALTNIQIQAFYTDLTGATRPILLPPNGVFSCKLMFRRKKEFNHEPHKAKQIRH